jgi:hypothetical protein
VRVLRVDGVDAGSQGHGNVVAIWKRFLSALFWLIYLRYLLNILLEKKPFSRFFIEIPG